MAHEITPPQPDVPMVRKRSRRRAFWRLFGWGSTACLALAAAVLISQTDAGSERLRLALAYGGEPAQAVAAIPPRTLESDLVTKRLAAQIRELAADGDRLAERVAVLERNLDDMTGSIKQQREELAATRAAARQPPPAPPAPSKLAPAPAPVATAPPPFNLPALAPLGTPTGESTLPAFVTGKTAAAEPAATAGLVPLPAVRAAAVPVSELPPEPPATTPFGIDLGGAGSIEALRIHWAGLKANYGPLLTGLHPLVTTHPKHPAGVTYRLVAGPLANTEEAARLCARFPALRAGCHSAKFEGAELAAP